MLVYERCCQLIRVRQEERLTFQPILGRKERCVVFCIWRKREKESILALRSESAQRKSKTNTPETRTEHENTSVVEKFDVRWRKTEIEIERNRHQHRRRTKKDASHPKTKSRENEPEVWRERRDVRGSRERKSAKHNRIQMKAQEEISKDTHERAALQKRTQRATMNAPRAF